MNFGKMTTGKSHHTAKQAFLHWWYQHYLKSVSQSATLQSWAESSTRLGSCKGQFPPHLPAINILMSECRLQAGETIPYTMRYIELRALMYVNCSPIIRYIWWSLRFGNGRIRVTMTKNPEILTWSNYLPNCGARYRRMTNPARKVTLIPYS